MPRGKKPKKQWYLAVGVSQIDDVSRLKPLPYATKDCQEIARLFEAGKLDSAVDEIVSLNDGDEGSLPTAANLRNCLDRISREAGQEDTVVVYLTCHGIRDLQDKEQLYFCLGDTREDEAGKIDLATAFSARELVTTLIDSEAKNILVLIDSCHSGALEFSNFSTEKTKNLYAILSCFPQQKSYSYDLLNGALMSYCLKQTLKGDFVKYTESAVSSAKRTLCCDSLYNSLKEKMETTQKRLDKHQQLLLFSQGQQQGSITPQQEPLRKLGGQQTDNFIIAEVPNVPITNIEPRRALLVEVADPEVETSLQTELKDKASFNNLQVWDGRELTKAIEAQLNVEWGTVLLYFHGKLLANNELQINQQIRLTASTLRQLLEQYQSVKQILLFDLHTEDEGLRKQWIDRIKIDSEVGQCIITNDCSQRLDTLARDVASLLAQTNTTEGITAADLIQQLKPGRENREYYLSGKRDIIEVVLEPRESSIYSDTRFWRNHVHKYFPQKISSNFLTSFIDSTASFKTKEFYVPLGLVERKKIEKKKEIESSEQGSRLYEPEAQTIEVTQTFAGEEFYRDILLNRQGKTKGGKIAITGEPGGGKTTLSQDICGWLLRNTHIIPIWISLARLGNGSLTEYLEQLWLPKIALDSGIELKQLQEALKSQFLNGNVWLILDGVDEINSDDKISKLEDYLEEGYIDYAKVVVTSRLNTWETEHQLFDDFKTYRTLPFSDLDIHEFISKFFFDTVEKEKLITQLEQNQRIKDLVRNPLRLMLLCLSWLRKEGTLPETQAQLYALFVEQFDKFKQNKFSIFKKRRGRKLKERINQTLGEISKEALDRDHPTFLIDFDSLSDELQDRLDEEIEEKTIYDWICDLGWLNNVGISSDDPDKTVYTFFHATFQEYFAATAIADWDYFLPREHIYFPVPNRKYRIFESQWKQVILFWVGQSDNKISNSKKETFISKLFYFDDGLPFEKYDCYPNNNITNFNYSWQALIIAGHCTSNFYSVLSYQVCSKIIMRIIVNHIDSGLENIILSLENKSTTQTLVNILNIEKRQRRKNIESIKAEAIELLGKIGKQDKSIVSALTSIINKSSSNSIYAAEALFKIDPENKTAVLPLHDIITNIFIDDFERSNAAEILRNIAPGNLKTISALYDVLKSVHIDFQDRISILYTLFIIEPNNNTVISTLLNIFRDVSINEDSREIAANCFKGLEMKTNRIAISSLIDIIRNYYVDEWACLKAIDCLKEIAVGDTTAILALENIIEDSYTNNQITIEVAKCLGEINPRNKISIAALENIFHQTSSYELFTKLDIARYLLAIDTNSHIAITFLINILVDNSLDLPYRRSAILNLMYIDNIEGSKVTSTLINILTYDYSADTSMKRVAIDIINYKTNKLNDVLIDSLIDVACRSSEDFFTRIKAIEALCKKNIKTKKFIYILISFLKDISEEISVRYTALDTLFKLNVFNYKEFYQFYYKYMLWEESDIEGEKMFVLKSKSQF